jgi:hypothetical protein
MELLVYEFIRNQNPRRNPSSVHCYLAHRNLTFCYLWLKTRNKLHVIKGCYHIVFPPFKLRNYFCLNHLRRSGNYVYIYIYIYIYISHTIIITNSAFCSKREYIHSFSWVLYRTLYSSNISICGPQPNITILLTTMLFSCYADISPTTRDLLYPSLFPLIYFTHFILSFISTGMVYANIFLRVIMEWIRNKKVKHIERQYI